MAHIIYLAAQLYALLGGVVAAWFLAVRIERSDPAAVGAYAFRPLLIPGLVLLWPLVIWRCVRSQSPAIAFRAAHRRIWLVLAVGLPVLVVASLALRQNGPTEAPPIRLAPPPLAPP